MSPSSSAAVFLNHLAVVLEHKLSKEFVLESSSKVVVGKECSCFVRFANQRQERSPEVSAELDSTVLGAVVGLALPEKLLLLH